MWQELDYTKWTHVCNSTIFKNRNRDKNSLFFVSETYLDKKVFHYLTAIPVHGLSMGKGPKMTEDTLVWWSCKHRKTDLCNIQLGSV